MARDQAWFFVKPARSPLSSSRNRLEIRSNNNFVDKSCKDCDAGITRKMLDFLCCQLGKIGLASFVANREHYSLNTVDLLDGPAIDEPIPEPKSSRTRFSVMIG